MKFKWTNRYSDTDKPDKHGRWARLCYCNGFVVGEIFLEQFYNDKLYTIIYRFPSARGNNVMGYKRIKGSAFNEANAKADMEQVFKTFIEQVTK